MAALTPRIAKVENELKKLDKEGLDVQRDYSKQLKDLNTSIAAIEASVTKLGQKTEQQNSAAAVAELNIRVAGLGKEMLFMQQDLDNAYQLITVMEEDHKLTNALVKDLFVRIKALEEVHDGVMVDHTDL